MLVLLFLAVTSASSAEQIAVSSILTYDVYKVLGTPHPTSKSHVFTKLLPKRYFNPGATEEEILRVSHYTVSSICILDDVAS